MSAAWPTTTVRAAQTAIIDTLRDHFGAHVQQIGLYQPMDIHGDPEAELLTPALLLELDAIENDEAADHAPGVIAVRCLWTIHAILSIRTENLQMALPEMAAAVIALIRQTTPNPMRPPLNAHRWGLGDAVGAPDAVSARPGEFRPGLHGHDAWAVSWEQTLYLPESLPTD
jgi:hypothetical protein